MTPDSGALEPLAAEATSLLKALAHPARLLICCELREHELSVGDIEATLNIKQPRLSRELAKLRAAGVVTTRRESKVIFYTLSTERRITAMVDAVCAVMLGGSARVSRSIRDDEKSRRNIPGGYGVFARTTE
jgi:DNA-binding transcriptional ArsR family regulator